MKTASATAFAILLLLGTASAQTPVGTSGSRPAAPPTPATPAPGTPAAATPASPAGDTAAASTAMDYRLAPGDKLRIEVYKDAQLSQALQVRPDGKVTLPLIGDIAAAGKTSSELRDTIATALTEYIASPTVTVIVTETTPQVVYVTGEVNKPGPYAHAGRLSIIQALAMAGGFTDFANKKDIRVLRSGPSGMQTLKFNYKEAIDDENHREPLQLKPGDTVVVK